MKAVMAELLSAGLLDGSPITVSGHPVATNLAQLATQLLGMALFAALASSLLRLCLGSVSSLVFPALPGGCCDFRAGC